MIGEDPNPIIATQAKSEKLRRTKQCGPSDICLGTLRKSRPGWNYGKQTDSLATPEGQTAWALERGMYIAKKNGTDLEDVAGYKEAQ